MLAKHDWVLISQKGSHRKWANPKNGLIVVVPWFNNRPLPIGTLVAIMKGAEIPENEWH